MDAGYLSFLAKTSEKLAMKNADMKFAKYIPPVIFRVNLYIIHPIPPFIPDMSKAFLGIENTKPNPMADIVLITNSNK